MCQIWVQWLHFWGQLVTAVSDYVSLQRYGQVIINYDHNVHYLLCGPHVPNLGAVVTLFDSDWLLLFLMMFHDKGTVRSS